MAKIGDGHIARGFYMCSVTLYPQSRRQPICLCREDKMVDTLAVSTFKSLAKAIVPDFIFLARGLTAISIQQFTAFANHGISNAAKKGGAPANDDPKPFSEATAPIAKLSAFLLLESRSGVLGLTALTMSGYHAMPPAQCLAAMG